MIGGLWKQCRKYYERCRLQNDNEVVLAAVTQDGWDLQFASEELRNDKDVVLAAVYKKCKVREITVQKSP